jgi:hypothetical protein
MRRMLRALIVASMCVLGSGIACSGSLLPAASGCSSDSECAAGLSCLALASISDAGCTAIAFACSKTCRVNDDCTAVGPRFKCFMACGGMGTCGQTP